MNLFMLKRQENAHLEHIPLPQCSHPNHFPNRNRETGKKSWARDNLSTYWTLERSKDRETCQKHPISDMKPHATLPPPPAQTIPDAHGAPRTPQGEISPKEKPYSQFLRAAVVATAGRFRATPVIPLQSFVKVPAIISTNLDLQQPKEKLKIENNLLRFTWAAETAE